MIKTPILHYPKDKNSLVKTYLIALIPLFIFGWYKNGLLLYVNGLISFSKVFLPAYFLIISLLVAYSVSLFMKENIQDNILICLIWTSSISLNTNFILYPILLFVLLFMTKYFQNKLNFLISYNSLMRILLLLSLLVGSYNYLNIGEVLNKFNYDILDIFIGLGSGGIFTTSILALLISYFILATNEYYKKIIPFIASLIYILSILFLALIMKDYQILNYLLNGMAYFSFIFLASDIRYTPYTKKGMLIYALLIGLFTGILTVSLKTYYLEASFLSIFFNSIFISFLDKIPEKRYLNIKD